MDDQSIRSQSLQSELTRWIFIFTISISTIGGLTAGISAYLEARESQDEVLFQIAQLVSGSVIKQSDGIDFYDEESTIIVQSLQDGNGPLRISSARADGFATIESSDISWRIYLITKPDQRRYAVAQQTELRNEVAFANAMSALVPIFLLAFILLLFVRWIIFTRMNPVVALAKTADNQDTINLNSLSTESIPSEIVPFIEAINRLLLRTRGTIDAQNRFIADASHELRTPITALSLLAENLENAKSPSEQVKRTSLLRTGLDRLNGLINQLLNLARLQNSQTDSNQTARLDEIAKDVMVALYPLAEQKNIDVGITHTTEVEVHNINAGLKQLVENGLANAIHYTPKDGKIDVSIDQQSNNAILTITDSGPGINEDDLEDVFTPFFRAKNNTAQGSGLGLAICSEIAKQHKGTITLKNNHSAGLIFTYVQPII